MASPYIQQPVKCIHQPLKCVPCQTKSIALKQVLLFINDHMTPLCIAGQSGLFTAQCTMPVLAGLHVHVYTDLADNPPSRSGQKGL